VRKNDVAFITFFIWSQAMKLLVNKLREFIADEQGDTDVNYGPLVSLIALIADVIVTLVYTLETTYRRPISPSLLR
jgi:Flp pilus assembly pilin Flp